ncbi:PQQ-binding-like beta-propeller repeat protein, partial [Pseudomonas ogarae]|uniref:outer membrane protein assembly factor BamB family protein n=1 Tax=Pseudomonas ogarae (strain DSM 112162 / CECT 30235 / F113) TaxID=1114970 RepID=UPI00123739C8
MRIKTLPALSSLTVALLLAGSLSLSPLARAAAPGVSWEDIANDHLTTQDVLQYGMGTNAQRWSPLAQVNDKNVFKLTPAWSYSFGDEKQRGQESQAIVSDGVVYVTGSYSRVFALDARTGKRLWTYSHRLPDNIRPCCDVVNRGAAIYGDKIYFGTLDARVVALDKNTGKVVWSKKVADHKEGYSISAAPMIVNGKLITGVAGGEFGVVGQISAFDPKNGALLWTRPTVEGHMGYVYKDGKAVENGISGGEAGKTWP